MGFRNPATSATAVDTGHGLADAGVRLYQDLSAPSVPQGVAEWRTGLMAKNATARLSGGGSGGSSFALYGGQQASGVDAPTLSLNVESAAAGGYEPAARISSPFRVLQTATLTPQTANQWNPIAGFEAPTVRLLANGTVIGSGVLQCNGTVAIGAGTTIFTLPAWARPANTVITTNWASGTPGGSARIDWFPNGAVALQTAIGTSQAWSLNATLFLLN